MSIREKHSLRRWGMTGLAGLMALTLGACSRIPQDGSPSNAAGKNLYIQGFGDSTGTTCPPTTFKPYENAYLDTSAQVTIWAIVKNDSNSKTPATQPENQVIQITNIHVEYEVPGSTMQIPSYDNPKGFAVSPGGGTYCSTIIVFSEGAKNYINKNRKAFPYSSENKYFQVNAKVQAQGYETNGGSSVVTPSAFFTINVRNNT